jgi:hypothetical protein
MKLVQAMTVIGTGKTGLFVRQTQFSVGGVVSTTVTV